MSTCWLVFSGVAMGAGTIFWMWYLIYEYECTIGVRKRTAWWERDISFAFTNWVRDKKEKKDE